MTTECRFPRKTAGRKPDLTRPGPGKFVGRKPDLSRPGPDSS